MSDTIDQKLNAFDTNPRTLDLHYLGWMNQLYDTRATEIFELNDNPIDRVFKTVDTIMYTAKRLAGHKKWYGIVIRNDTPRSPGPNLAVLPQTSGDSALRCNQSRGVIRVWIPELHSHLPNPLFLPAWDKPPAIGEQNGPEHKLALAITELYPRCYGPYEALKNLPAGAQVTVEFPREGEFEDGQVSVTSDRFGMPILAPGQKVNPVSHANNNPRQYSACPPCADVPKIKSPRGKDVPAMVPTTPNDSIAPVSSDEDYTKWERNGVTKVITPADAEWFARVVFGESSGHGNRLDAQYMFWALTNRMGWGKSYWAKSTQKYFSSFSQPINPSWAWPAPPGYKGHSHCGPAGRWAGKDPCNPDRLRRRAIANSLPLNKFPKRIIDFVNEFLRGELPNPDPNIVDWMAAGMFNMPRTDPNDKSVPKKTLPRGIKRTRGNPPEMRTIIEVEGNSFIGYWRLNGQRLPMVPVKLIPGKTRLVVPGVNSANA